MYSTSGLPRDSALPTITRSGAGSRFFAEKGSAIGDTEFAQKVGHRWIGGHIGAGDSMPFELQHSRQRSHGRAANADQMNVPLIYRCLHSAQFPTADSKNSKLALDPPAASSRSRRASIPNGSVTFDRETWPERSPIQSALQTAPALAKSPHRVGLESHSESTVLHLAKNNSFTLSSLPARIICLSMRSIW